RQAEGGPDQPGGVALPQPAPEGLVAEAEAVFEGEAGPEADRQREQFQGDAPDDAGEEQSRPAAAPGEVAQEGVEAGPEQGGGEEAGQRQPQVEEAGGVLLALVALDLGRGGFQDVD